MINGNYIEQNKLHKFNVSELRERAYGDAPPPFAKSIRQGILKYVEFENVEDYIDSAEQMKEADDKGGATLQALMKDLDGSDGRMHTHDQFKDGKGDDHFYITNNFKEAIDIVRHGEDTNIVGDIALDMTNKLYKEQEDLMFDVCGAYPDVDRFLIGDPECMVDFAQVEDVRAKYVDIVVNYVEAWHVTKTLMNNRTAALVAAIDILEQNNFRVRCRMLMGLHSSSGNFFGCSVGVKNYDEPISLEYIMGALSAASYRRLGFAQMGRESRNGTVDVSPQQLEELGTLTGNLANDTDATVVVNNIHHLKGHGFDFNSVEGAIKLSAHILDTVDKQSKTGHIEHA